MDLVDGAPAQLTGFDGLRVGPRFGALKCGSVARLVGI
jgi:hypothetical protein